jgi:cob(I)alamin adenosyltransferase
MNIYTKAGDGGKTSLFSGERIPKCAGRIEAYGDIDELTSILGALAGALPHDSPDLLAEIRAVQTELFVVGARLATTAGSAAAGALPRLDPAATLRLEGSIDRWSAALPPLERFIFPGGHAAAAWAHVARTVCRRAERRVVALFAQPGDTGVPAEADSAGAPEETGHTDAAERSELLAYLNRLSDYLFAFARHCNRVTGTAEVEWRP